MGSLNETGRLTRVLMKHARDAFVSQAAIDAQWRRLNFTAPPDFLRAIHEYDRFAAIVAGAGAEIWYLTRNEELTLDSIYARDASLVSAHGSILCEMGKPQRTGEPEAQGVALADRRSPLAGRITAPGHVEGGDLVWLD